MESNPDQSKKTQKEDEADLNKQEQKCNLNKEASVLNLQKTSTYKDNAESAPLDFIPEEESKITDNMGRTDDLLINTQNRLLNTTNNLDLLVKNNVDNHIPNDVKDIDNKNNNAFKNDLRRNEISEKKPADEKYNPENIGAPASVVIQPIKANHNNNTNDNPDNQINLNIAQQPGDKPALSEAEMARRRKAKCFFLIILVFLILTIILTITFASRMNEERKEKTSYSESNTLDFQGYNSVWLFLSKLFNVNCLDNHALSSFNLIKKRSNQYTLSFTCLLNIELFNATSKYIMKTPETEIGANLIKDVHYLDRQEVKCPNNHAIASFKFNYDEQGKRINYNIGCISVDKNIKEYQNQNTQNKFKDNNTSDNQEKVANNPNTQIECKMKQTGKKNGAYDLSNLTGFQIGEDSKFYLNGFQLSSQYQNGFFYHYKFNQCGVKEDSL